MKSIGYTVKEELSQKAKNMLGKLNNQEKPIDYRKLNFTRGNKVDYGFSEYRLLKELFNAIYYRNITIEKAERIQEEFNAIIDALKKYKSKKAKHKENKEKLLINAQNLYDGTEMIINAFKKGIFPLVPSRYTPDDDKCLQPDSPTSSYITTVKSDESDESNESNEFDFTSDDLDKMYIGNADDLDKLLLDTEKYLHSDLIEKYFFNKSFKKISEILKQKKDTPYGKIEVALIKNKLKDLKNDIKYMPDNEVKNKRLDLLAGVVEKILDINGLLNIPDLKSEEYSAQRQQKGQGLKILTPPQMITRLCILLAQLKAENNSQKFKNEIRQLLYSLYR